MRKLGKLEWVDAKELWGHEAKDFTPWLQDNIHKLSEAIELEIDIFDREVSVGEFNVDLYGKELGSNRPVIIENQLYPTDHVHLGQLLTYASGLEAGVVIWISPMFRDEHKKTLDWLNGITNEDVSFFGIELEVLKIDDSSPAVNFKLAVKPTEWKKRPQVSRKGQLYHDFFSPLLKSLKEREPDITAASSVGYSSGIGFGAGRSGFYYGIGFTINKKLKVELYIDTGDLERNNEAFDFMQEKQGEIEDALGMPLSWERLDDKRASRIAAYTDGTILDPPEKLQSLSKWAVENMLRFRQEISKKISDLSI